MTAGLANAIKSPRVPYVLPVRPHIRARQPDACLESLPHLIGLRMHSADSCAAEATLHVHAIKRLGRRLAELHVPESHAASLNSEALCQRGQGALW